MNPETFKYNKPPIHILRGFPPRSYPKMSNVLDLFEVSESRLDEIFKIINQIPMENDLKTYINIARREFMLLCPKERDLAFTLLGATIETNMTYFNLHGDE